MIHISSFRIFAYLIRYNYPWIKNTQQRNKRDHDKLCLSRGSQLVGDNIYREQVQPESNAKVKNTIFQKESHLFIQTPSLPQRWRVRCRINVAIRRIILHVQNIVHAVRHHCIPLIETRDRKQRCCYLYMLPSLWTTTVKQSLRIAPRRNSTS